MHDTDAEKSVEYSQFKIMPLAILGIWSKHLLSLYFPTVAMIYFLTAPHVWYTSFLIVVLPATLAVIIDRSGWEEIRQPHPDMPNWPFDLLIVVGAGFQFVNLSLFVIMVMDQGALNLDCVLGSLVMGISSAFSAITLSHEFIHRKSKLCQWLGRMLLISVIYEHFYTEHLRGHHVRVATKEDPATAVRGETFLHFYVRTVPAQFGSAWNLERSRLGDPEMGIVDVRTLKNRVFHGLMAELMLLVFIFSLIGPGGIILFLIQAIFASRTLEVVNYFEHWGLLRQHKQVSPEDSWDTYSWFTYYGLVGLTRHADHHARPTQPYQQLRVMHESPKLPFGYVGMVPFVIFRNRRFLAMMETNLEAHLEQ